MADYSATLRRTAAEIEDEIERLSAMHAGIMAALAAGEGRGAVVMKASSTLGSRPSGPAMRARNASTGRVVKRPGTRAGSRAGKVRNVFETQPNVTWTAEKLLAEIGDEVTEATVKATHAVVARLYKTGFLLRVGRGEYRRLHPSDDVDTDQEVFGELLSPEVQTS